MDLYTVFVIIALGATLVVVLGILYCIVQLAKAIEEANKRLIDGFEDSADILTVLSKQITEGVKAVRMAEQNASLVQENEKFKAKQKEYRQFFATILEVMQEDTTFIRSTFFQRFGAVPEYQDLNKQILAFETRLASIKDTLREYRMIETYDE